MPLDNFDKKIQQVTENILPAFDESDWMKMEMLLDKNLPVKKDRRRFLFILVLFLMLGLLLGGIYFSNNPTNNNTAKPTNSEKLKPADTGNSTGIIAKAINPANNTTAVIPTDILTIKKSESTENEMYNEKGILHKTTSTVNENNRQQKESNSVINSKVQAAKPLAAIGLLRGHPIKVIKINNRINNAKPGKHYNNKLADGNVADIPFDKVTPTNILTPGNEYSKEKTIPSDTVIHSTLEEEKMVPVSTIAKAILPIADSIIHPSVAVNQKVIKNRTAKKNQFAFTVTTGLEASGTKVNRQGKLTPVYGFGLQYSIGKKIMLRTGLNVVKKIYSAQDGDYKAPPGSWAFNVTFKNIQANCKVLEIPFSVAYKITAYKKGSLYASIGSSSYFMKREDYQFYFKGQNGNDTTRSAHFINKSNHLFSSLNFSAVAEKRINNKFSLLAEPFIKLPLRGIGFGKVKLYNTGILLTAKFKIR